MKTYTEEEVETIIRCCWNNARMTLDGSIADIKNPPNESEWKKRIWLHSWPQNWSQDFLKKFK